MRELAPSAEFTFSGLEEVAADDGAAGRRGNAVRREAFDCC